MCRRASLPVRRGRGWRQAAPGRQFRLWSRRISRPISPKAHASTTRRSRSAAFDCMNTPATDPVIGVINAGSSSVKFSFYEGERRILGGQVDGIGAHLSASAIGPYLSERQWGTVREDYSDNGDAWNYFSTIRRVRAPTT